MLFLMEYLIAVDNVYEFVLNLSRESSRVRVLNWPNKSKIKRMAENESKLIEDPIMM